MLPLRKKSPCVKNVSSLLEPNQFVHVQNHIQRGISMNDRDYIKNINNKNLGYTQYHGNRLIGYNLNGRMLGYYENNKTYDINGKILCVGNILSNLILKST